MSRQRSLQSSAPQWIATALAISCLLATTPSHAGHKGLTIAIDWSPTKPEKESVWLGYLMARANYIAKHTDAYPQQVGPVIPSFEEEVEQESPSPRSTRSSRLRARILTYHISTTCTGWSRLGSCVNMCGITCTSRRGSRSRPPSGWRRSRLGNVRTWPSTSP